MKGGNIIIEQANANRMTCMICIFAVKEENTRHSLLIAHCSRRELSCKNREAEPYVQITHDLIVRRQRRWFTLMMHLLK